ncbi:MAG: DUF2608 domain-containing protein [Proteobacteria bacterium]|nr:DUF2608 domain-containing protein [Pseudomonadota bacterium]
MPWQSKLIEQYKETHVVPEGMVATSIPDLLNLQTTLTNLSPMMPVELRIPSSLQKFVERGSSAIALTSRSPSMGDKTRFELERAGFPYRKVNFETSTDWALEHQPYNLEDIETSGLSKDDVIEFSLKTPRDVVFKNGVYLTQGQHKGIMLKTLMHKMKRKYNAIVFVDDRAHHLEGMQNAFKTSDLAVTTVQYIHERDAIERFNNSSKEAVKAVWCEVSQGLIEFKREHEGLGFLPCAN